MKLQLHAHVHSVSSQVRIPSCSYMPDPALSLSQDSWFSCSRCNINIIALVIFLTSVLGFIGCFRVCCLGNPCRCRKTAVHEVFFTFAVSNSNTVFDWQLEKAAQQLALGLLVLINWRAWNRLTIAGAFYCRMLLLELLTGTLLLLTYGTSGCR